MYGTDVASALHSSTNLQDRPWNDGIDVQRVFPRVPSSPSTKSVDSPAQSALRRLSSRQATGTDIDAHKLRRMSTALSATLNVFKSRPPRKKRGSVDYSVGQQDELSSNKQKSYRKKCSHLDAESKLTDGPTGHKTLFGWPTPSSITLRRASLFRVSNLPRSSMSASLSCEDDDRVRDADALPSELLAFYSSLADEDEKLRTFDHTQPTTPLQAISTGDINESNINARRHSGLAATAVTFADVFVAPGTFTISSKPRKESLAAAGQPARRISVVQFRSRNSIHEVVWREDETSSGSSLGISPQTSSSLQSQKSKISSPKSETRAAQNARLTTIRNTPVTSSKSDQPSTTMFQWTWSKEYERRDRRSCIASASNPELARPQDCSNVLHIHRRSVSDSQEILSFPPLRDRSSTLEWCRAPPVDLNDPLAGQVTGSTTEENIPTLEHDASSSSEQVEVGHMKNDLVMLRENFHGRRVSSHVHAPARIGPSGRVGSSIGSSSHVRVLHPHRV